MIASSFARRARLIVLATGIATLIMVALPGTAHPAFPGANGKIAFIRYDGTDQIYVMNADGSGETQLTTDGNNAYPSWSPDGSKIAFASDRNGYPSEEIYLMNADGSGQTRLTSNWSVNFSPTWSPDGSRIAFASNQDGTFDVYVMNADGSGQIRLTINSAYDAFPAWSPDGSKIAFVSDRDGNDEIYVMNADGSGQTRLTANSVQDLSPAWSPDGNKIAFSSFDQIYVMNADGSGQTQITANSTNFNPTWSPDGTEIAFSSYRDGEPEIYVMNADGSGPVTRLTTNGVYDALPNWQTIPSADLALSLAASPAKQNQPLTYTITTLNAGPSAASGVVVTDVLPSQATFVSATPSRGSCLTPSSGSTGTITCDLGSLASSQNAVTQIVVKLIARKTTITNTASVASTTSDPNTTNNTASITTPVK